MDRFILTDVQWAKMEPLCLGKKTDRGRSGKDNRLFIEAILWIARTSGPWRDLPRISDIGTRSTHATATG
ncbi:transposase [Komagataeibacter rhaeticus]